MPALVITDRDVAKAFFNGCMLTILQSKMTDEEQREFTNRFEDAVHGLLERKLDATHLKVLDNVGETTIDEIKSVYNSDGTAKGYDE